MEFEERTRAKQYGDPRFAFLYGGEFADYYRFRVIQEIQRRKKFFNNFKSSHKHFG